MNVHGDALCFLVMGPSLLQRLAVDGWWRFAAVGGWRLAAICGWRLVAVGGGWRLVIPRGCPEGLSLESEFSRTALPAHGTPHPHPFPWIPAIPPTPATCADLCRPSRMSCAQNASGGGRAPISAAPKSGKEIAGVRPTQPEGWRVAAALLGLLLLGRTATGGGTAAWAPPPDPPTTQKIFASEKNEIYQMGPKLEVNLTSRTPFFLASDPPTHPPIHPPER